VRNEAAVDASYCTWMEKFGAFHRFGAMHATLDHGGRKHS
jgi:hypothetical protein